MLAISLAFAVNPVLMDFDGEDLYLVLAEESRPLRGAKLDRTLGFPEITYEALFPGKPSAMDLEMSLLLLAYPNGTLVLADLEVVSGFQTFAARPLGEGDSTRVVLEFSPPIQVAVDAAVDVVVRGGIADDAASGVRRLTLIEPAAFDAADANSQAPVTVSYDPDPVPGARVDVQMAATASEIAGSPRFPELAPVGAGGIAALEISLHHPGPGGTAAIRLDAIALHCADDAGTALVPADYLDRVRVWGPDTLLTEVTGVPASAAPILVPLPGVVLGPGETLVLTVEVDLEATAPSGFLELALRSDGVDAVDANTAQPVTPVPAPGEEFPFRSGLVRLQPPAQQLLVDAEGHMPVAILPSQTGVLAATYRFTNSAASGSGDVVVDRLVLSVGSPQRAPLDAITMLSAVQPSHDDEPLPLAATNFQADTVELVFSDPLPIPAQGTVALTVHLDLAESVSGPGLRLGLDRDGVGIVQPEDGLLEIRADPAPGQSFPFWTQAASLSPTDLAESYSNYPNPFAAGREVTSIQYVLPGPGRVTLRLYAADGAEVATLLDGEGQGAGLNVAEWDGRNGRGDTVRNGIYVAWLRAELDGGGSTELTRRIVVVR